jgi:hypothetical protein
MALAHPTLGGKQEEEWRELQAVLQSGILDKASNLRHFLEYVAEQHFAGKSEEIKEYSIAVHALHRLEQFDPQSDTIVRVSAHTLRKKLEQYYAVEGADHPIQIRLPAGKYVLQFERREPLFQTPAESFESLPLDEELRVDRSESRSAANIIWAFSALALALILLFFGSRLLRHRKPGVQEVLIPSTKTGSTAGLTEPLAVGTDRTVRLRFGPASKPYVDVAGETWLADQYCKGGTTFSHANHSIEGTDDPSLFQEGREGKFQCRIPAPPGTYQLQLLFADTAGDKEAARQVDLSINNSTTAAMDIVDEGGGDDVVVGKVFAGLHPMSDGTIHLDFNSDASFVNAAELTPYEGAGLPLRMVAGPATFRDEQGNIWLPERFFVGGRRSFHADNLPNVANSRLFEWERYGRFGYLIPAIPGKEYNVRLYFSEGWFGKRNGGPGGTGSRVFDVYCNGTTLLKSFDIVKNQKDAVAIVTFEHIKPTAHGMLEINFRPVENYPLINAIEVTPEE